MNSNNIKMQFVELRARGLSYDKIAVQLKKSKQTLIKWSKELECEISNFQTIEFDALKEKYRLSKQSRIEIFGKMLEVIKHELEKRDLKKIPTEKLLIIYVKYLRFAQTEDIDLFFKIRQEYNDKDFRSVVEWKP